MKIGILSEKNNRVVITPDTAKTLISSGHDVFFVESAGVKSGFLDNDYLSVGAKPLKNNIELLERCQLITSFKIPKKEDLQRSRKDSIFFNYSNIVKNNQEAMIISSNGSTLVGMEFIEDSGKREIAESISDLESRVAFNKISFYYNKPIDISGNIIGNIPFIEQTKVSIIGCGLLGNKIINQFDQKKCLINVFEKNYQKISSLNNLNASLYSINDNKLEQTLMNSDIIISCASNDKKPIKKFISNDFIKKISKNTMIFDFSTEYGGTFATSKPTTMNIPLYSKDGVIHCCPTDLLQTCSRPTSILISNCALKYILLLSEGYMDSNYFKNAILVKEGIISDSIVFLENEDYDINILKNPFELMEHSSSKSWKYTNDINDFNELLDNIDDYDHGL